MMSILVLKKERNKSHLVVVNELEIVFMGFRSLLIVEKRVLGLLEPDWMTDE